MAAAASRCLLDQETQSVLLEIIGALKAESETGTIELDGGEIDLEALEEKISSCSNVEKRGQRKRGPRQPSEYNKFIGKCRKGGEDFKSCVAKWNEKKGGK
jgi:hypothetical protein